jgi:hypothetical protein
LQKLKVAIFPGFFADFAAIPSFAIIPGTQIEQFAGNLQ